MKPRRALTRSHIFFTRRGRVRSLLTKLSKRKLSTQLVSSCLTYRVCLANMNFHNKRPGETSYDSLGKTEGDRGFRLLSVRGLKTLHVFLLWKYLLFIKYVAFWIIIAAIIICTCCYYSIIRADSDHMSFFPCRTNFIVHCNRFIKVSW